ncbi:MULTISPECIES: hypothetical protein [unclassified Arcicella]|uniref:hypothetical protein n=1 Tax=unclassified Arcicella TaxID=2644986 RepID=UPI002861CED7|nr:MULTISPECIES: hypothetical protein [unclassified Arcicella]MDR6561198.1 hypothetical protein [Arcicella sp. BE51]MDR6811082.1 hypothetical protein [Arcicella sp. BE140]MDR6822432.1 hypothetical protein [Arcicella sp. BE139]
MEEYNPNRQSEQKLKIAVAVLIILVTALGFLYFRERQFNKRNEELGILHAKDLLVATTKLDSIENQLNTKIIEIKRLGGDVSELVRAKEQLQKDKIALQKSEGFSMKRYESKIKKYLTLLGEKDNELINLRKENGILAAMNDSLSKEAQALLQDVTYAQKALNDSAINYTLRQKELSERNRELSEKVSQASALHAESINVYAISTKGKESDGGVYKSKKVDKVRITFYLQENPLTNREAKVIFLRIIDPQGQSIADMSTGSGSFTYKNKEVTYTAKQKIVYDNSHQSVEFVYSRGQAYKEGRHIIELYAEGYKIGDGFFEVK